MKSILQNVTKDKESSKVKSVPTKRAPDGWDSVRFLELFLALAVSRFAAFFSPAAGNASRWVSREMPLIRFMVV